MLEKLISKNISNNSKQLLNFSIVAFVRLIKYAGLVGGELGAEGVDGVETALVTDLVVEGDLEVETVDVLVEVEDVGLNGALASGTDGRTDTDVAHPLELAAKRLGLNRIDTVARQQLQRLVELDVSRRKTYSAAKAVARHHNSQQGIFIPEHRGGGLHLPGGDSLTDLRGAYRHT